MSANTSKQNEVETVEEFVFEPIKGYPMLNWRGKRPFRSTKFYPAQLKEQHGDPTDGRFNKIFWGDNLQVMSHLLKEYRGKVDLIYIDPPFDSKADYKKRVKLKAEKAENDHSAFEEKQYTDIWTNDEYLQFMFERITLIKELLSDSGSLYVHCDPKKNHLIRMLLDEVFGEDNFKNEIVWHYEKWTAPSKSFQKNHDTILFYTKTKQYDFNEQKIITDNLKAKYKNGYLIGGGYGSNGLVVYDENHPKVKELIASGKYQVHYAKAEGKPLSDVWKVPFINPVANERLDYPTQKPEKLIERVILSSTNRDSLIFDCFMGSGTTQAVAMKLGRRFIGADINLGAVQTTTKRLLNIQQNAEQELKLEHTDKAYTGFQVFNVNHYDVFRNPVQAKELLIEALEIQPLERNNVFDGEKDGRMVKVMPVDRIATRADLNELLSNFDYKTFEKRKAERPNQPVEKILIVCMGHEPDLAAVLEQEAGYKMDVDVVDILRDRADLQFKRDAEAKIEIKDGKLVIENFYPMNLLQKLSIMKENVDEWRELVESVMIDWNYDGAIFEPKTTDIPDKKEMVNGTYDVPKDAGTIRIKITDLLSESLEVEVKNNGR